jgi:hypothetical protein
MQVDWRLNSPARPDGTGPGYQNRSQRPNAERVTVTRRALLGPPRRRYQERLGYETGRRSTGASSHRCLQRERPGFLVIRSPEQPPRRADSEGTVTHGNPALPNAGSKLTGPPSAPAELPVGVEAAVAVRRGDGSWRGELPPR